VPSGECSECKECPVDHEQIAFRNTYVLDPENMPEGKYVPGHLEDWGCEMATCDQLISCRDPLAPEDPEEAALLLSNAFGGSVKKAKAYLNEFPGRVVLSPRADAVQILGCNGALHAVRGTPRSSARWKPLTWSIRPRSRPSKCIAAQPRCPRSSAAVRAAAA
jgi:hypothetical protein